MESRNSYWSILLAIVLLPLVFVVHHLQRFFPFLSLPEAFSDLGRYLFVGLIAWILPYLFLKNIQKANFLCFLWLGLYFFFNPIHEFVFEHFEGYFFSQYRFIIPFLIILSGAIIWRVTTSEKLFLNLIWYFYYVLFIFMGFDLSFIAIKYFFPGSNREIRLTNEVVLSERQYKNSSFPDIYLLVYDELASTASLKEKYGYQNLGLDDALQKNGFVVFPKSHANYYWTQFSMASLLNMSYLKVPRKNALQYEDYLSAMSLIKYNSLVKLLTHRGYLFRNYSPFEVNGYPAKTRYTENDFGVGQMDQTTLFNTIIRDIGWNFRTTDSGKADTSSTVDEMKFAYKNLQLTEALVKKEVTISSNIPRFTYGHFFIAHAPYLFDSSGMFRSAKSVMGDDDKENGYWKSYLNGLPVVNAHILELVRYIKFNSKKEPVIIVMGDHGFRPKSDKEADPSYFSSFFAISWPGGLPPNYPDSLTHVNQFRALLSNLFQEEIPLLTDSVIYLHDK